MLEDGTDLYDAPEFYDLEYERYRGDVLFYLHVGDKVRPQPILEYGCGTGRLSFELAKAGHKVDGIDIAPFMLAHAQRIWMAQDDIIRQRVSISRGHLCSYRGRRQHYGAIIAAFNVLQHIDESKLTAALETSKYHLQDNGLLAFDLFAPPTEHNAPNDAAFVIVDNRPIPGSNLSLCIQHQSKYDSASRVLVTRCRYLKKQPNGLTISSQERVLKQRQWSRAELVSALSAHGFDVVEEYGDVDFSVTRKNSPRVLIVARLGAKAR